MRKILVAICMASAMAMSAQLVVDQGQPENQFEVGLRLGFNSSNVSNNYTEAVADMKQAIEISKVIGPEERLVTLVCIYTTYHRR